MSYLGFKSDPRLTLVRNRTREKRTKKKRRRGGRKERNALTEGKKAFCLRARFSVHSCLCACFYDKKRVTIKSDVCEI
jgi:hypothetical protein